MLNARAMTCRIPWVRRVASSNDGSMILMFALLVPILVMCAGLGIDYLRAGRAASRGQMVVDSAVLAAVRGSPERNGEATYQAYVASKLIGDGVTLVVATGGSADGMTFTGSAQYNMPSSFSAIFGSSGMTIRVSATATRNIGYQEFYFLVDLSGSLGVAATAADRDALQQLTQPYVSSFYGTRLPQGCAFGCHRREGWEPGTKTVYEMARDAGIKLREDELVSQFGGLIDLLLAPADPDVISGRRKVSVIGFSNWARQLIGSSTSADDVKQSLADFTYGDRFETDFANAFAEVSRIAGEQGNGSQARPAKTIILISDGIESRDAFFAQRALDVSRCDDIKSRGFRLAVVELKYPRLESNALYDDTVAPVESTISPTLQSCASQGWYFQALDNDDVPIKFEELKNRVVSENLRLIQ